MEGSELMRFIFDTGIVLGDNDFKIAAPITGLESPDIRTTTNNYSGRDGGRVEGSQLYSGRLISIPGFIIGDSCDDHESKRVELVEKLPKNVDIDVEIELSNFSVFTTVRVLDIQADYTDPKASRYKVDLYAGDPNLYTSQSFTVGLMKEIGGGFTIPFVLPVIFDPGSSPTVVNNSGSVTVYPQFRIEGETTNPRFTNVDTGEFIELTLNASTGDVVVIDTDKRTATLNGASVLYLLDDASTWLQLNPGDTRIQYSTDNGSDDGTASVTWRNAIASV